MCVLKQYKSKKNKKQPVLWGQARIESAVFLYFRNQRVHCFQYNLLLLWRKLR